MNPSWLMLASVVPMVLGAAPADKENSLIVSLCNGGTITIPLGNDGEQDQRHCDIKACHAGNCRKLIAQGNARTPS